MLRVGIMLDSWKKSAWLAASVEQRQAGDFARIKPVVLATPVPPAGSCETDPNDPIVSDERRALPAEALFREKQGRLIRPSQDCAKGCGYALVFSEALTLSPTEYKARILGGIDPTWVAGNQGTHTYTRAASFEVIDGNFPAKLPRE